MKKRLPELLSPAGSPAALEAALSGGADAVYFGGPGFNARIRASNFSDGEISEAIRRCHSVGVRAYITLNTQVCDREMFGSDGFLKQAEYFYRAGADALIVADLGGALLVREYIPGFELHASTQMSGHNAEFARTLHSAGFSRMVCARELGLEDIRSLVSESPLEIEMFVHGALCVSHSGQCLFSSIVGGRSGNKGECAQPCRLPYKIGPDDGSADEYPLSLRDLCLARHIPSIIAGGAASLKIEGRMRSPEYVYRAVSTYRRLLDERRGATDVEIKYLAGGSPRGGFTDGYFRNKPVGMAGATSNGAAPAAQNQPRPPRKLAVSGEAGIFTDRPAYFTLAGGGVSVSVYCNQPRLAGGMPINRAAVEKCFLRFGGTSFDLPPERFALQIDDETRAGITLSDVNSLRRAACAALLERLHAGREDFSIGEITGDKRSGKNHTDELQPGVMTRSARFMNREQIPPEAARYFDIIYLPLAEYAPGSPANRHANGVANGGTNGVANGVANGVVLPPVITGSESETVTKELTAARLSGAKFALLGNIGHIETARMLGFELYGDLRLNVFNSETVRFLDRFGFYSVLLSPELNLAQMRGLSQSSNFSCGAVVYGRLPMMLTEICLMRDSHAAKKHTNAQGNDCASCGMCVCKNTLTDRRGVDFPVFGEPRRKQKDKSCRNIIYNSVPVYMADRADALTSAGLREHHFIFTNESADDVRGIIAAYKNQNKPRGGFRRIK